MKKYVLMALLLCLTLCLPTLAAAEDAKPMMDIVWVVDCTGSMPDDIDNVRAQLANFASKLTDFDVQYGLVGFGDELNNRPPQEPTVKIQWNESDWTSDINALTNSMASGKLPHNLPQYFGDDKPETPTCGLYMAATEYAWRENAVHAIVLVTDYDYKTQGTSLVTGKAIPSMQECLDACGEKNISINLLDCGTTTAYDNAVTQSGGVIGHKSDEWSTAVGQLAQWIHNAPIVITQPEDQYVHEGDRVVFEAASHPVKECIFEWYHLLNGYTTSSYVGLSPKYPPKDFVSDASKQMDGMEVYCRFSNFTRYDKRSIDSRHAILRVASEFAITGQPQPQFVDAGQTATFIVAATGDDLTYQWQKQSDDTWVDLSGKTADTLSIPATLADDGSVYRCVIKDAISDKQPGGYTLTSDSAALTVVDAPAITGNPQDVTTEAGKTAAFTVAATGNKLTYQWQQQVDGGWADMPGETGTTLTVSATMENSGSVYRCQVTSGYGTVVESQSAALTVDGAPAITGQPENVSITEGEDASFTVTATGEGLKYQWQVYSSGEWMNCAEGQMPTLTLNNVALADDGQTYRCVITSGYGTTITSDTVTLTVLEKVKVPLTGDASRLWLWLTLLGASLLGLAMQRRRHA